MASFQQRVIGAMRLNAATYEDVEHDTSATGQAALVVLLSSLANGLGLYVQFGVVAGVLRTVYVLLGWAIGAALLWIIGTRLLPGRKTEADWGQLLRTVGYAQAPGFFAVLAVVPVAGPLIRLAVALWVLAAVFVAVRQALDYDDLFRAALVVLIAWAAAVVFIALTGVGGAVVSSTAVPDVPAARRHRWRRLRRPGRRPRPAPCAGRRGALRPQEPPRVHAAPVPGGDGGPVAR